MTELYPPLVERGEDAARMPTIVVVCEHATNVIPPPFRNLGLDAQALKSHIAWDPGAFGVAQAMRRRLTADLVAGAVSRLIYDSATALRKSRARCLRFERYSWFPAIRFLSAADREARTASIYTPFRAALEAVPDGVARQD